MKKTLVMAAAAVLTGSMAYPSLAEEYVFEMAPVVVTANRMNENLVDARAVNCILSCFAVCVLCFGLFGA